MGCVYDTPYIPYCLFHRSTALGVKLGGVHIFFGFCYNFPSYYSAYYAYVKTFQHLYAVRLNRFHYFARQLIVGMLKH